MLSTASGCFQPTPFNRSAQQTCFIARCCLHKKLLIVIWDSISGLPIAGEFIKDTEEYINIELDSSRNRLIRLEIVLTAGTFGVAIFSLVAGDKHLKREHQAVVPRLLSGFAENLTFLSLFWLSTSEDAIWLLVSVQTLMHIQREVQRAASCSN